GSAWSLIDPALRAALEPVGWAGDDPTLPWTISGTDGGDRLRAVAARCGDTTRLIAMSADAGRLASVFGIDGSRLTLARARDLGELAAMADAEVRPERPWFDRATIDAVAAGILALRQACTDLENARRRASDVFTEDVLALDLEGIASQVGDGRSWLPHRKVARADRQALGRATREGRVDGVVLERLDDAIAWQQATEAFVHAEATHANVASSPLYAGQATDWHRLADAHGAASRAVELVGDEADPGTAANLLSSNVPIHPELAERGRGLRDAVTAWLDEVEALLGLGDEVSLVPLGDLGAWCGRVASIADSAANAIDQVSAAVGRPLDLDATRAALDHVAGLHRTYRTVEEAARDAWHLLGEHYPEAPADWAALDALLERIERARAALGGAVPERLASRLLAQPVDTGPLAAAVDAWRVAADAVADAFTAPRRHDVARSLEGTFESIAAVLDRLVDHGADLALHARQERLLDELDDVGVGALAHWCVDHGIGGGHAWQIVETRLLSRWAADVLDRAAPASRDGDPDHLEELLTEYRGLDRRSGLARTADARRAITPPRPTDLDALRSIDDLPELLERGGDVIRAAFPCVVATVEQATTLLPPDWVTDVVVADLAQRPSEARLAAVAARGDQLVLAVPDDAAEAMEDRLGRVGLRTDHRSRHPDLALGARRYPCAGADDRPRGVGVVADVAGTDAPTRIAELVRADQRADTRRRLAVVVASEDDAVEVEAALAADVTRTVPVVAGTPSELAGASARTAIGWLTGADPATDRAVAERALAMASERVELLLGPGAVAPDTDGGDPLPFEVHPIVSEVAALLRADGLSVEVTGRRTHRCDLLVGHPDDEGPRVAIELDEHAFDAAPHLRDRVRLGQEELLRRGLHHHQVCASRWLLDRDGELARVHETLDRVLRSARPAPGAIDDEAGDGPSTVAERNPDDDTADHTADNDTAGDRSAAARRPRPPQPSPPAAVPADASGLPAWASAYTAADLSHTNRPAIDQPVARPMLNDLVRDIVDIEAPVHRERVRELVLAAWPAPRTAADVIDAALGELAAAGLSVDADGIVTVPGRVPGPVRLPTADLRTRRAVAHVPLAELGRAVHHLLGEAPEGCTRDDLVDRLAALYRWEAGDRRLSEAVDTVVSHFVAAGHVTDDGTTLRRQI
ncbi:MAG: DUF3320 domain-containing protein, partial [Actinomycetota bacterium]|nr:DUF3320 domain-containing protein [Actinomycetota bacterium]